MKTLRFYQLAETNAFLKQKLKKLLPEKVADYNVELCYNIKAEFDLNTKEKRVLYWILANFSSSFDITTTSNLMTAEDRTNLVIEIGPRLNQRTPFCTNTTSICQNIMLTTIKEIEVSTRYHFSSLTEFNDEDEQSIVNNIHDKMTECRYHENDDRNVAVDPKPWYEIDVINGRSKALAIASEELGLAFDDWDIKFYANLFRHQLQRNPTSVECFDLAQSNSEHSRHWFFKANIFIDGEEKKQSLFSMVTDTLLHSNSNNVIAFHDNGSAIKGEIVEEISVKDPCQASEVILTTREKHLTLTAETHNFPTGVAPFPGATTGTGGRQRDQHAIGRGAHIVAGTVGYCVGNLNLDFNQLPWEDHNEWGKCSNLAPAARIIIEASDGASDYGNKFGEPVIAGFFRTFGQIVASGERVEWLKPIMFSGGVGALDHAHLAKQNIESDTVGLLVAKIGGPAYRIGVGGGSASSLMHGENAAGRDFDAVQRGDPEMQQKLNRLVRGCVELREENPILSIHDQGAGGNGNVIKEIVDPSGADIYSKAFSLGDLTLTPLELWTAEYQESDAVLFSSGDLAKVAAIGRRERCGVDVVGKLNGTGRIVLREEDFTSDPAEKCPKFANGDKKRHPVDLDLSLVLGKMPNKTYNLITIPKQLVPIDCSKILFEEALNRVLQLPAVASKRFLTNKVDRCVGGLIAQQQCVGPLHTPLSDVAVTALSHFATSGTATAVGEQPVKMLVDEGCGARMAVGEALTNLVFAKVSRLGDVKCSANWMWPAKLPGEGAKLYSACEAMCGVMKELGIGVDGGKDSLSMAANVGESIVKCPGSLVISAYAPCSDILLTVTPDLKCPNGSGQLLYIPMSNCKPHLGGSAFAQCFSQLGDETTDLNDPELFKKAWKVTQDHLHEISAGHDISDGGFVTAVLEMAFAGNCGIEIDLKSDESALEFLFSERLGLILECRNSLLTVKYKEVGVNAVCIGRSFKTNKNISLTFNGEKLIDSTPTAQLRDIWENTSFALESLQCNNDCVNQEREWLLKCDRDPDYFVSFEDLPIDIAQSDIKVAVLREEGSNGDREMCAAFYKAGFQPWDVTMQDIIDGNVDLSLFRGLVFVGGFSYADVLGSAKGWAACCQFNAAVNKQFSAFKKRTNTFSLGVCNGCQLMALLGWVCETDDADSCKTPDCHLANNESNRFESRFVEVEIQKSNSIMFDKMEGSRLGVWVAHGEGRFKFQSDKILNEIVSNNLAPLRYVDRCGDVTTQYPLNPNGSPLGIAGLCSKDGRHLAIMPHPERSAEMWQWPYNPPSLSSHLLSPWARMFQNALLWCQKTDK